ncbi:MAG: zinc-binding alcohol dehydrogenase [Planctomycetota bacterium]|nr:zinc-binding alcohol dehydrogenase [Planctomycetota bacterium]
MRQLVVRGTGEVALVERPAPTLDGKPPGAIVRTRYAVIGAGSTLPQVGARRKKPDPKLEDRPLSYQISGLIQAVTPGLKGFAEGDAVCCPGGGFAFNAEEVFIPVHLLGKLRGERWLEPAATVNLAVTGLHACRRARSTLGEWNVVAGLGLVGQFAAQFAKHFGAYVVGTDIQPLRLEAARACGIERVLDPSREDVHARVMEWTAGHGADAALIAARSEDDALFESVNRLVNPDLGRIVVIGRVPVKRPDGHDVEIMLSGGCGPGWRDEHYKREGHPYPFGQVRWSTDRNVQLFADLLCEGRLATAPLLTHRYPAEQADAAYTQLLERPAETLGVVLVF